MRFREFIAEKAPAFDLEKFKEDCAFYLAQRKGVHPEFQLFRGDHGSPQDYFIRTFQERATPRNSPVRLHNEVNEFFEKKFGYKFRNGMFSTGHFDDASLYGGHSAQFVSIIFPIGKFEWLSNLDREFRDMTALYDNERDVIKQQQPSSSYDERIDLAVEETMRKIESSKTWRHNTDLDKCLSEQNEIMLKMDKYYYFKAFGPTYQEKVKPFLLSD